MSARCHACRVRSGASRGASVAALALTMAIALALVEGEARGALAQGFSSFTEAPAAGAQRGWTSRWARSVLALLSPADATTTTTTNTSSGTDAASATGTDSGTSTTAVGSAVAKPKPRLPCSLKAVDIPVRSEADFAKRVLYPPSTTVRLNLMASITLRSGLVFARNYSCTILRNGGTTPYTLATASSLTPLLTIFNTSNVLVLGINLRHAVSKSSKACAAFAPFKDAMDDTGIVCPAVLVVRSWGVQVAKGSVYGRIDVFRSMFVRLDWLTVTMPEVYSTRQAAYKGWNTHGIIRVGTNSAGTDLLKSWVVISNCEVYGGWELITVYLGAVGVVVRNNYLHHYYFTAMRMGANAGFVMEAHLNTVANNLVVSTPGMFIPDSAALYFCTHWFNPGNVARCNYVIGGDHCYYLDLHTTALTIDGGVCIRTGDTVKINTGKLNKVRSLVVVDNPGQQHNLAYTACLWTPTDTCFVGPSRYWDGVRRKWWSNGTVAKVYPWMNTFCPPPTSINGVPCNPNLRGAASATYTGKCSGLPYLNDVDLITVNSTIGDGTTCDNTTYPTMTKLNKHTGYNAPRSAFINAKGGDYGALRRSPIFRARPAFRSCRRSLAGRQPVNVATYYTYFNRVKPFGFDKVLAFNFRAIIDYDVKKLYPY